MADVATTTYSSGHTPSTSGRAVSKMPGTQVFSIEPKINQQTTASGLENAYTSRFDHLGYYDK